jgi:hypothetical protein
MPEPIYKLYLLKAAPAWFGLSKSEQEAVLTRVRPLLGKVGAKSLLICKSNWASERWSVFGMEEFPDCEAEREHARMLEDVPWPGPFFESYSILGTKGDIEACREDIHRLLRK